MSKKRYVRPRRVKKEKDVRPPLTDNVKLNEYLSPLYFLVVTGILYSNNYSLFFDFYRSSIFYGMISTFIYIFSSNYFQPDLDVLKNRPGMGHFPFGRWVGGFKIGRFLKFLAYPINRLWYYLWAPFAKLFTHRGACHWPIIGTWLRIVYLYIILILVESFIKLFFPDFEFVIPYTWMNSFFPWDKNFFNLNFLLFNFPIYLSDFVHIATDFVDSRRRNLSFCPPQIPRGILIKLLNTIRGIN